MNYFNEDVLRIIFDKVEKPSDLINLRAVSKQWYNIIEDKFNKFKIWKELCINDEIKPWIYKLVERRFPQAKKNWSATLYQGAWKKLYMTYRKWQMIRSFQYLKLKINIAKKSWSRDKITCIDAWANYIAVGTSNGRVYFYKNNAGFQPYFKGKYKLQSIIKIKFWYTETKLLIAVIQLSKLLGYARLKYWDVKNKESILNPFKDEYMENFACNNHRLFIATSEMIYECIWDEFKLGFAQFIKFSDFVIPSVTPRMKILEMCADPTKLLVSIWNSEDFARTFILNIPTTTRKSFTMFDSSRSVYGLGQVNDLKCYAPMPGIVTYRNNLIISVNLSYETLELVQVQGRDLNRGSSFIQKMEVSSIFLHCNILFLGLKSGNIAMYFLKNVKNLISLDFANLPSRIIQVSHDPITNLMAIFINGSLYILSATASTLHFIQFMHNLQYNRMN